MSNFAAIADEIKLDILSKTHALDNAAKRKAIARTFISDAVTAPTEEMFAYAALATVGDDEYTDPSTAALEAHVAKITGKEAGVFLTSGTLSNQIALRSHLRHPPYSVLCDNRAYVYKYDAGGAAFHSGAAMIAVAPTNGHHLTLQDVKDNIIISDDSHFAPTEVIELENTLNGIIFPQQEIVAISEYAHSLGLKLHLDGARIWHVAAETRTPLAELLAPFDSASMCFSKGLGAPVGSVLVGSKAFIAKARGFRTLFGGSMRQTGILAGCAAYALTHNFPKLPKVHVLAKKLEAGLEEIGCAITTRAETCMVFYDPASIGATLDEIRDRGSALPEPFFLGNRGPCMVVHIQTSETAVDDFLNVVATLAAEKKAAGFVRPESQNGSS
ncbi:hypothetical protein D9619_011210 [Psilocybe cf. subviscida]|uniref:Aromatic amino acid beta-eliminating lyase/threonine aldolase domain-containing protein n=1 Tax=Psilocybe cf. subviscida TaxID=2480587 RepID=A0A8H5BLE9_9AGAR|nr:hypothetical protein D9619_011210 [Psilocybe cf. subviscida]